MSLSIILSGASGFVGGHILRRLCGDGYRVVALMGRSRPYLDADLLSNSLVSSSSVDLSQPFNLDIPFPVDAIIHTAARSPATGVSVASYIEDNIVAAKNMLALARSTGARKLVFLSTLSVHGDVQDTILDEKTPVHNPTTYGLTKLLCEQLIADSGDNIASISLRLPGVIGPRSVRNWLTRSLSASLKGEDIRVFNPESPFNNAVHVSDLSDLASALVADVQWRGHEVVCLGADGDMPAGQVAQLLALGGGRGSRVIVEPAPRISYRICSDYAKSKFKYTPMETQQMLSRFVQENIAL